MKTMQGKNFSPPRRKLAVCLFLATLFCLVTEGVALEEIRPPFGFQWGESLARMEQMLVNAKAKIVSKEPIPGGTQMKVTGISQRLLRAACFKFQGDSLTEIELQYGDPAWDTTKFSDFFDQTRRHLDERYGTGKLIAREKSVQNGITNSLIGYQWTQLGATLQLFYFTAESEAETTKVLSIHYRSST